MDNFNVDEIFEGLVVKYGIDKCFARYAIRLQCIEILNKNLLLQQVNDRKIILVSDNKNEIEFVSKLVDQSIKFTTLYIENEKTLAVVMEKEQSSTYIVCLSYYHKDHLYNLFLHSNAEVINIYDIFELQGVKLNGNFYDIFNETYYNFHSAAQSNDYINLDLNSLFFYYRRQYEQEKDSLQKQLFLQKIIFICSFARDFLLLKQYILEYINANYSSYCDYISFLQDTETLLADMRCRLQNRTDDIIYFWLDALEYGEDGGMPFLKSVDEKALVFDEAFTVTPYTQASAKNLFCASKVVDDHSYRITNIKSDTSPLFEKLEAAGYEICYYGILKTMDQSISTNETITFYTPATLSYWYGIRDILQNDKKVFCVLHEIAHTHQPYISMGLTGEFYSFRERTQECSEEEVRIQENQMQQSRSYLDKQLEFYSQFFSNKTYKIYASDHGHTQFGKYHTIMKIAHETIEPCRIGTLFSYLDFQKLISYLLKWEEITLKELEREFVEVQDVDYYFGPYIQSVMKQKVNIPESCFGYRGLITKDEIYLKYKNGSQYFLKRNKSEGMISEKRKKELEEILGDYSVDVNSDEKFIYSSYLYKVLENYQKRDGLNNARKKEILNQIFKELSGEEVIALRGGGYHTFQLFFDLTWQNRKKIKCIIDNNKDCQASLLGIPIITLEEIKNWSITSVIISSYFYKDDWKAELEVQNQTVNAIKIINLYDQLCERGMECKLEYYHRNYIAADFDVNFPEQVYNEKV